jgi:hypothetical protein
LGELSASSPKGAMAHDSNPIEAAVSRALRENLERIQKTSDELHHAVNDVVAACGSNKATHALPPLVRAQTAAASLSAALDVLTRFVAISLQPGPRSAMEAQIATLISTAAVPAPPEPQRPQPSTPVPMASAPAPTKAPVPPPPPPAAREPVETELELHAEPEAPAHVPAAVMAEEPELDGEFDVNRLSSEEQELHRRANRVAKVSMQDIKMLRPEQVRLGREKKDLCIRLKDDIEKAHREYDRRFKPIMDHPVDYFYRWMVEILAEGDAHALGEYPYATPQHK